MGTNPNNESNLTNCIASQLNNQREKVFAQYDSNGSIVHHLKYIVCVLRHKKKR